MRVRRFGLFVITLLFIMGVVGCFKQDDNKQTTGYKIFKGNESTSIVANEKLLGAEVVLNGTISEKDIIIQENLLKIVKYSDNKTVVSIAGDVKSDSKIVNILSPSDVLSVKTVSEIKSETATKRSGEVLLGDFDLSGTVDLKDFQAFAQSYGTYKAQFDIAPATKGTGVWADINCYAVPDKVVNLIDFIIFAQNYGKSQSQGVVGLILVEGGTFSMGENTTEYNSTPVHSVTLSNFYIGKYEVTQKEWKDIMVSNVSATQGENFPVTNIDWIDAVEFCNKKSEKEGLEKCYTFTQKDSVGTYVVADFSKNGYRLPTEAEWEYAARGGKNMNNYKYSGSDNLDEVSWNSANSGNLPHVVGTKKANALGIYDMSGNVAEFCSDWYASYSEASSINPTGANTGNLRIVRGGSFAVNADLTNQSLALRNNKRDVSYGYGYQALGFRLAKRVGNGASLTSIAVTKQPTKTNYNIGDTELNLTGLVVTGTYSDGTTKIETVTTASTSGFSTTTAGTKTITITIAGKSTSFSINVTNVTITLQSIAVTTLPTKINYYVGDTNLELAGLVVTGTYSNGTTKTETVTTASTSGFSTSTAGSKNITVTIGGKSAVFTINVSTPVVGKAIIIDHTSTDLSKVPSSWITSAKQSLKIGYGHTSHGSQIITGMEAMRGAAGSLLDYTYSGWGYDANSFMNDSGFPDAADLGGPWDTATRTVLNTAGCNRNVVMWSWCGQADGSSENIVSYLSRMSKLETDYPNIKFVYMTGHLVGSGANGNLNLRNQQIRDYCRTNNKILYDFADIESFDPSGQTNYMTLMADDGCNYDSNNDGNNDKNWASDWVAANPNHELTKLAALSGDAAHTMPLNGILKARAFWWLAARLAGWNGTP